MKFRTERPLLQALVQHLRGKSDHSLASALEVLVAANRQSPVLDTSRADAAKRLPG
ncbi:hypothetical protein ABLE91_16975 [Aquabacter sp. CN5-332]|uniref:hypothetical protein n=1 Tax=Aquabacter sp. CN5-332 TaxID=3156608 RepID=UPI0032B4888E